MVSKTAHVEVHLFGGLRRLAAQQKVSDESVVRLNFRPGMTVGDVLKSVGVPDHEMSNVFRNGRLASRTDALKPGDRLGVFPTNMSLLYC